MVSSAVSIASLALSIGFYAWMLGGPRPLGAAELKTGGENPLQGLPAALGIGFVAAILLAAVLGRFDAARPWTVRLAAASAGLYLAGAVSAIGAAALVLGPSALIAEAGFLRWRRRGPRADSFLLALHACGFTTAVCFFHQWPSYWAGWEPLLKNFAALRELWF